MDHFILLLNYLSNHIYAFHSKRFQTLLKDQLDCAQFHGSAYSRILRLWSQFPAYVQAPNFCASLVSVECLVTWSMHVQQKPKFAANLWNMLSVNTYSVSADSVLTISRAMKLGPVLKPGIGSLQYKTPHCSVKKIRRPGSAPLSKLDPFNPTPCEKFTQRYVIMCVVCEWTVVRAPFIRSTFVCGVILRAFCDPYMWPISCTSVVLDL